MDRDHHTRCFKAFSAVLFTGNTYKHEDREMLEMKDL